MLERSEASYLEPATFIDSDAADVREFARAATRGVDDDIARAIALYQAVREAVIYDPYVDVSDPACYRASAVLAAGRGYCVGKASLLAAAARAAGVPARVGYADVRNHMTSPRLYEALGTDIFHWHSYADLYLDGRWVKASPTFNSTLCGRFGVAPLDFDGGADALLQAYDGEGRTFMQYEVLHGSFHDVPAKFLMTEMARLYPQLKGKREPLSGGMEFEAPAATG